MRLVGSGVIVGCLLLGGLLVSGCGGGVGSAGLPAGGAALGVTGSVHGGQQPVSGSRVYLYAVSRTADAGAATSLLTTLVPGQAGFVLTDLGGNFSITGDYSCPAGSYVYLLSVGGNPGLAGGVNRSEVVLASGLGPCAGLTGSTRVSINEVTTVVMAYAFRGLESSPTQIGSATAANVSNAFTTIGLYVDSVTGFAKSALPADDSVRQKANSLADSVAACVNSVPGGGACAALFAATAAQSVAPTDTFSAVINEEQNPTMNVLTIYNLGAANGPFQPTLSQAPATWSLYDLPTFFAGQQAVGNGVYSLTFPDAQVFGTYTFGADPHNITLDDLGAEYVTDAADGKSGVYLYDYTSGHTFYTSPSLYPYLYDNAFQAFLYYFTNTKNPRVFYNFGTSTYISLGG